MYSSEERWEAQWLRYALGVSLEHPLTRVCPIEKSGSSTWSEKETDMPTEPTTPTTPSSPSLNTYERIGRHASACDLYRRLGRELETDLTHKSAQHIVGLAQEIAEVMDPVRVVLDEERKAEVARRGTPRGIR